MNARVAYLDTSAFVKLVIVEPESASLRRFLARWPERTSSTLLRTEAIRALRRSGHDAHLGAARRLFRAMQLVRADEPLLDRAGEIDPRGLRSLDAVHLVTALALGSELGVVITYDQRLGDAAVRRGLAVESPS